MFHLFSFLFEIGLRLGSLGGPLIAFLLMPVALPIMAIIIHVQQEVIPKYKAKRRQKMGQYDDVRMTC